MRRIGIYPMVIMLVIFSASCGKLAAESNEIMIRPIVAADAAVASGDSGMANDRDNAADVSSESDFVHNATTDIVELEGTINDTIKISMNIKIVDGKVEGSYFYDTYKTDIKLDGMIEANRMIILNESDSGGNITGTFDGWYVPGVRISGTWTNKITNEILPFELKVLNGANDNAIWNGVWKRIDADRYDSSNLVIYNETDMCFDFQIDAYYGANIGFIEGNAVVDGTKAAYHDEKTGALLSFTLENGFVELNANDQANAHAGAGVSFGGEYTKNELNREFTLVTCGYLDDEEQDLAFNKLAGQDSVLFLNTAHICVDGDDLDGYGAKVYNWWVAGIACYKQSIIMFLPDGYLCAAVIDAENKQIKVYTNASYINDVPKTIETWSEKFPELTMAFINRSI